MTVPDLTVIIATYPERWAMLVRAIRSVQFQVMPPATIIIASDVDRVGAAENRQRALETVKTKWTAVLDDDDEFKPEHLLALYTKAQETDADMVFSWFEVVGGGDPFPPEHAVKDFDPEHPHQTTITTLYKTESVRSVGGYRYSQDDAPLDELGNRAGEDFHLSMKLARAGFKIVKCPGKTWLWHHHGANTSGLPVHRREQPLHQPPDNIVGTAT